MRLSLMDGYHYQRKGHLMQQHRIKTRNPIPSQTIRNVMGRIKRTVLPKLRHHHYFILMIVTYLALGLYIMNPPLTVELITGAGREGSIGTDGTDFTLREDYPPVIPQLAYQLAELENKVRISRLEDLCKHHKMGKYRTDVLKNSLGITERSGTPYSWFAWNKEYKLGYCPVFKSGYTSWINNMLILKGISKSELESYQSELHSFARYVYGNGVPEHGVLSGSRKLIVVRHPFDRLLSAYQDKLEHSSEDPTTSLYYFYDEYESKIVSKVRKDHLITKKDPTFEEFVRFLLSSRTLMGMDEHWLPIYLACSPCQVDKWDFIAKTETYTRDQAYIIRKLGLEEILQPRWNHQNPSNIAGVDHKTVARQYFGQLTKKQIKDLAMKYLPDFLLFDYAPDEYIQYGKD